MNKQGTPDEITLEYSTDKKTWTEYTWSDNTGATVTLANIGDSVWWRGDNTAFSSDGNVYRFIMTGSIEASGNIMSLLDKTCKSVTIPTEYCFFRLFAWNLALKTAPELPATKLATYCYYNMFEHCTSLTKAPELPATTMVNSCYFSMFIDCTSLTTAPELPATTMADYCYYQMFSGCSSLTTAPELPATTMADYCYSNMFVGCTSLTKAPELPATTLAYKCYSNMFVGCTNLKKIKVNFAAWFFGASDNLVHTNNWLSNASSTGVFECPSALDCSTRDFSHVPAGWTIVRTDAPASGGTIGQVLTKTADGQEWADAPAGGGGEDITDYLCFTASQANSTIKLDRFGTPPTISLEYSTDKKNWTEYTWDGKNGATITLANIGDNVWWRGNNTAFSLNINNAYRFTMSGSIEASGNVMSLLDKSCKSVTIPTEYCFLMLFAICASLKKAPELPATTLANWCYYATFYNCTSLATAPELPATTLAEHCYDWMFHGCSSLTKAPELPATTMVNGCYKQMFQNCTSLQKAPELPATTLAEYCYDSMFQGCTSLREAELPQRTPTSNASYPDYCYDGMFINCTNLNKLKVNFTWWQSNLAQNWLYNASATGVFECPSSLNCSERNDSRVPAYWTIVRTDSPNSITSPIRTGSDPAIWIAPYFTYTPVLTVSSAITLNGSLSVASTDIAYAEIVLDVATGATVTAGANITLVDEITAGKRNICVCRWSGGACKLYVTIVEDLPQA